MAKRGIRKMLDTSLGVPRELHLSLTGAIIEAIAWRYGNEAATAWAWNETPMPCGYPSPEQFVDAIIWVFAKGPAPVGEKAQKSIDDPITYHDTFAAPSPVSSPRDETATEVSDE